MHVPSLGEFWGTGGRERVGSGIRSAPKARFLGTSICFLTAVLGPGGQLLREGVGHFVGETCGFRSQDLMGLLVPMQRGKSEDGRSARSWRTQWNPFSPDLQPWAQLGFLPGQKCTPSVLLLQCLSIACSLSVSLSLFLGLDLSVSVNLSLLSVSVSVFLFRLSLFHLCFPSLFYTHVPRPTRLLT